MADVLGPERPGGQGLDRNQDKSGNRAILALLRDRDVGEQVDLVVTRRDATSEIWAARVWVRFERWVGNGDPEFVVVEQIGANPIADQRHTTAVTCAQELRREPYGGDR